VSAPERLVAELARHVSDPRVLEAIAAVPRHRFLPPDQQQVAWENAAQPIGCGQTISQPLVVARMCEVLELGGDERVLDVGTGSGYHAAVLAELAREVWTVERYPELAAAARAALLASGYGDVHCVVGDGSQGLPDAAPFDAINVAAAVGADVPESLVEQLARGGRLVAPVGSGDQRLALLRRTESGLERTGLERVRFVPLVSGLPGAGEGP
jgi:protein-L-isoaspartate(D-aspartate) O-methyltransferase